MRLQHLGAYMTTKCNQKCSYCKTRVYRNNGVPDMSPEIIEATASCFPSIHRVKIGAPGEALTSPNFPAVVDASFKVFPKVAVGTNGTLIKKVGDAVDWGRLANTNVSITDPNPSKYQAVTGTKLLHRVVEGLEFLRKRNARFTLSYVITRNNTDRIPDFLRFARNQGAHKVVLQSICGNHDVTSPTDPELRFFWKNIALVRGDAQLVRHLREIKRKTKGIFPRMVLWPRLLERNSAGHGCNMARTYIAVDGNGDVALCCGGPGPRPEMGNISQGPSVWNTGPMRALRRKVFSKNIKNKPTKCLVCRVNYRSRV